MNFPKTVEEANALEKKISANQKAGDWTTPIFPFSGIGDPNQAATKALLKKIGGVRPPKPKS